MIVLPPVALPDCTAAQIVAHADGRDGDFNGMSHAGTLLVLRNVSHRACRLPGLPAVTMIDTRGRPIPAGRNAPVGMHPGPVVLPVTLAPGARASVSLRWVSGQVFDGGRCYPLAVIGVRIGGRALRVPARGQVCAAAGRPAGFDQPVLRAGA